MRCWCARGEMLPRGVGAQERKLIGYEGMVYYVMRLGSIRCVWNSE